MGKIDVTRTELVMGSLPEKFAGKINLIYIDPPFAGWSISAPSTRR